MVKSYIIILLLVFTFLVPTSHSATSKAKETKSQLSKKSTKKLSSKSTKRKLKRRYVSAVSIKSLTTDEVHAQYFNDDEIIDQDPKNPNL